VRLSLRFLIPLLLALAAFAYVAVPLADSLMQRWFVRDLDMRSNLIADTVQEPLSNLILTGSTPRIVTLFNRLLRDERLYAVGLCLQRRGEPVATPNFPRDIDCSQLGRFTPPGEHVLQASTGPLHIAVVDVDSESAPEARLVLVEIPESPSLFFRGMAGSRIPVVTAHGEGRALFTRGQQPDAHAQHGGEKERPKVPTPAVGTGRGPRIDRIGSPALFCHRPSNRRRAGRREHA